MLIARGGKWMVINNFCVKLSNVLLVYTTRWGHQTLGADIGNMNVISGHNTL